MYCPWHVCDMSEKLGQQCLPSDRHGIMGSIVSGHVGKRLLNNSNSQTSVSSIHPHCLCLHKRLSFPNSHPDVCQNIVQYQMCMRSNLKIAKLGGLVNLINYQ